MTVDGQRPHLALMCVHAHPDDEAISTGGVLLRAAAEGARTAVVTCTGGERGEIHNMDESRTRPRLAAVRRAELAESLRLLGAGEPRLLGYVDSGMLGTDGNDDPASFWRAPFDQAVGRLVAEIREFQPDVLVTYDAFGGYGHPDHVQNHRVALVAAEACAVAALYPDSGPAWRIRKVYLATIPKSVVLLADEEMTRRGLASPFGGFERVEDVPLGVPDADLGAVVDVGEHVRRKREALNAHRSQMDPQAFFATMPEDLIEAVFGTEWFVRQRSDVDVPRLEHDLLTGLR